MSARVGILPHAIDNDPYAWSVRLQVCRQPAVDEHHLTADVAARVRRQVHRERRRVRRPRPARFIGTKRTVWFAAGSGLPIAGECSIHPCAIALTVMPLRPPLLRERAREVHDAGLRRAVRGGVRDRPARRAPTSTLMMRPPIPASASLCRRRGRRGTCPRASPASTRFNSMSVVASADLPRNRSGAFTRMSMRAQLLRDLPHHHLHARAERHVRRHGRRLAAHLRELALHALDAHASRRRRC